MKEKISFVDSPRMNKCKKNPQKSHLSHDIHPTNIISTYIESQRHFLITFSTDLSRFFQENAFFSAFFSQRDQIATCFSGQNVRH